MDSVLYDGFCFLLEFYTLAVFARVLLSWFPINPHGKMAAVAGFFYVVTDPVINPVRRWLPALRLGGLALDLSPIIVIIGLRLLRGFIC